MKKFLLTAATLAMLSTGSLADDNTSKMRKQFFAMTDQMLNDQMSMLKMQETMLTNYQRILKTMMENELNSH